MDTAAVPRGLRKTQANRQDQDYIVTWEDVQNDR